MGQLLVSELRAKFWPFIFLILPTHHWTLITIRLYGFFCFDLPTFAFTFPFPPLSLFLLLFVIFVFCSFLALFLVFHYLPTIHRLFFAPIFPSWTKDTLLNQIIILSLFFQIQIFFRQMHTALVAHQCLFVSIIRFFIVFVFFLYLESRGWNFSENSVQFLVFPWGFLLQNVLKFFSFVSLIRLVNFLLPPLLLITLPRSSSSSQCCVCSSCPPNNQGLLPHFPQKNFFVSLSISLTHLHTHISRFNSSSFWTQILHI